MKFYILSVFLVVAAHSFAAENINDLDLDFAQKLIAKSLACGKKNGWKLSVAVVNGEGTLKAFARDDGSYVGSIDAAIQKAVSANAFQRPTKAFADSIKERPGLVTVKNIVAIEGGLPIVLNGKHVGAIGISGAKATEDEQCAKTALEQ